MRGADHVCAARHGATGARCGLFASHVGSHEGWGTWPSTGRSGWIRWTSLGAETPGASGAIRDAFTALGKAHHSGRRFL